MDTSLRLRALPRMLLVEEVFGTTRIQIAGDNQSMLRILKTGRNPTMRHLPRTHRVSVAWLHEQHIKENFEFAYVSIDGMVADIFTKSIHVPAKWTEARKNIIVFGNMDEWHDTIRHTCRKWELCHAYDHNRSPQA